MKFMLDTNICIDILRRSNSPALKQIISHQVGDIGISVITLAELEHGVKKSANPAKNAARLIQALSAFEIADFDNHAAATYGLVRAQLESKGKPIGPLDTLIASHALSIDAVLVTDNMREFKRVKGLTVENWIRKRS